MASVIGFEPFGNTRACTKHAPEAGPKLWLTDVPEDKVVFSVELEDQCWVESVTLTVVGASHVEVRATDNVATPWRDARRLVPKTEVREMYTYKANESPENRVQLTPNPEEMSLSYVCLLVSLSNNWDPLCQMGLRELEVRGVVDDDPQPHPSLPASLTPAVVVFNPHEGGPERVGPTEVYDPQVSHLLSLPTAQPVPKKVPTALQSDPSFFSRPAQPSVLADMKFDTAPVAAAAPGVKAHYDAHTLQMLETLGKPAPASATAAVPATMTQTAPAPPRAKAGSPPQETLAATLVAGGAGGGGGGGVAETLVAPQPPASSGGGNYLKPLEGVTVCLSGFKNPQRSDLRDAALSLGARFTDDFNSGGTHLICAFANTPKAREVRQSGGGGFILRKEWLEEAQVKNSRPNESEFAMQTGSPHKKRRT